MGVLVASAIGLIVITGITKLFVHTNSQLKKSEQSANRTNLTNLIANYMNSSEACKRTLSDQMSAELTAGTDKTFGKILTKSGGVVIDLNAETARLKAQYGMTGYVVFKMNCAETSPNTCKKCSGTYPQTPECEKKWNLSLISQTKINGFSTFNNVFKIPIVIKHTGTGNNDFECNSPTSSSGIDLANATCPTGEVLNGFDTNGQPVCVPAFDFSDADCPTGQVLQGFDTSGQKICVSGLANVNCPTGQVLTGIDNNGQPVCVITGNKDCVASTINLCNLSAKSDGGSSGSCQSGATGSCSYRCNNGKWSLVSNTCISKRYCYSKLIDLCIIHEKGYMIPHGKTRSGTCENGAKGSCSYKCNNGTWSLVSNTCKGRNCYSNKSDSICWNPVFGRHGEIKSSKCKNYKGECNYKCNNGIWVKTSDTCSK